MNTARMSFWMERIGYLLIGVALFRLVLSALH